jgi:hypothetical protein
MAAITCPKCRRQFTTPVYSIVDVGQDPAARDRLLQGQINLAICPQCGASGTLSVPFLYHDPEKELLFAYSPPSTVMDNAQQQRFIGVSINTVMASLPAGKRKGYLFQPRTFLSMETMLDEIIMADGISRQQMESQRRKLRLLQRLLNAISDDVIQVIARENEQDLDYEFFLLLNDIIERRRAEGNEAEASRVGSLHQKLLQYSDAARHGEVDSAEIISKDELLKRLLETDDEEQQKALVAAARPLLDYGFFQVLTSRIEKAQQAGNNEKANQLLELRSRLLDWTDKLDAEVKKIWERKAKLIEEILHSKDWRAALEPNWQEIDPIFLTILDSNVELAKKQGNEQAAAPLQQLADLALVIAREHAPPEVQLLNKLLEANYPEGTQRILEQNRDRLDAGFLDLIDGVVRDMAARGLQVQMKALQLIRAQAKVMLPG